MSREIYGVLAAGDSGWVRMMNTLPKDQATYDLYESRKLEVVQKYRERVEADVLNETLERMEYEKMLFQKFRRQIAAERYAMDFMAEYNFINSD